MKIKTRELIEGYYTPEPSEIRVGAKALVYRFNNWKPIVINSFHTLKMVFRNFEDGDVQFPLLSDQYLQDTGWIKVGDTFQKGNFTLDFKMEKVNVFYKENRVFSGKCKGENTFNSISKMLKI